jgi:hypothetical protein
MQLFDQSRGAAFLHRIVDAVFAADQHLLARAFETLHLA